MPAQMQNELSASADEILQDMANMALEAAANAGISMEGGRMGRRRLSGCIDVDAGWYSLPIISTFIMCQCVQS